MRRPHFAGANRRALLAGTALASTLIIGTILSPAPASAQLACPPGTFPPPGPIDIASAVDAIDCVNVFDRNNGVELEVIDLATNGLGCSSLSTIAGI